MKLLALRFLLREVHKKVMCYRRFSCDVGFLAQVLFTEEAFFWGKECERPNFRYVVSTIGVARVFLRMFFLVVKELHVNSVANQECPVVGGF